MFGPVNAELNFTADKTEADAFEFPSVNRFSTGESLYLRPFVVPIHDLRASPQKPSLDEEGFTWASVPFDDGDGTEGWEARYSEAVCEWLRNYLGATTVRYSNYNVRRNPVVSRTPAPNGDVKTEFKEKSNDGTRPALAVHCDYNKERAAGYLLEPFESEEERKEVEGKRIAIINIWKPLGNTVKDAPLALCDGRCLNPADMERTVDIYGGGYYMRHNPNQNWFYLRDQTPNEILIFRQFDSTLDYGKQAGAVPHTAFVDEQRKGEGPPRQSIEVRCSVIY